MLRLNLTTSLVTRSLEKFDAVGASAEIEKFVDDLSAWYIRRSRGRVGPAKENEKDSRAFYTTGYYVLTTLCKILSPFTPFITDSMYTNLTREKSVHLTDWPNFEDAADTKKEDLILLQEMVKIRTIVEQVHAKRKDLGIPVRQPLAKLQITNYKLQVKDLSPLLKDELNIKEIDFKEGKGEIGIKLDTKITPQLKEEARIRELVRNIQEDRKKLGLNLKQKIDVSVDKIPEDEELLKWMTEKAQIGNLKKGKYKVSKSS